MRDIRDIISNTHEIIEGLVREYYAAVCLHEFWQDASYYWRCEDCGVHFDKKRYPNGPKHKLPPIITRAEEWLAETE